MILGYFKPFKLLHFSGFVKHYQKNIDDVIEIESSSVFSNLDIHKPNVAFNFDNKTQPAATAIDDNEKWISFTLKDNNFFYITHYEIQQRNGSHFHLMQKWLFQGKLGNNKWITLDTNEADDSFNSTGANKLVKCDSGIFNSFRLKEIKQQILAVNQIEIYGIFCDSQQSCKNILNCLYTKQKSFIFPLHFFVSIFI